MLMKLRMLKVGSWCEARPFRVRTEARESIPWLSLLQVGIGYEWRVLPSLLNAVWRQDVAGAASQATWLVQNSSAVFRGQCCAQWAPNRDVEKGNQTVCVLLPALMYQLGPPEGNCCTCERPGSPPLSREGAERNELLGVWLHWKLIMVLSMLSALSYSMGNISPCFRYLCVWAT